MRQNPKYPILTVTLKKSSIFFGLVVLFAAVMTGCIGCTTKTTIKIPKTILEAKDATEDELLDIVNRYGEIKTLIVSDLKADYISEKIEGNLIELKDYPNAPGLMLLKRPDSINFVIMAPTPLKNKILSLVSVGDEFRVLYHRENTFYIGPNDAKELISEDLDEIPEIPIRADHLIDAIFPKTILLQNPEIPYALKKLQDESMKYYVLEVYRSDSSSRLHPIREFWIERTGLTISRQRVYDDDGQGQVVGDITYSDVAQYGKYEIPKKIQIERPLDGYTLNLEFKGLRINPGIEDERFDFQPLPGMKVIRFTKK